MAEVKVSFRCGCGYQTENIVEAVLHSDKNNHSLDAMGRIIKDKGRKKGGRDSSASTRNR